MKDHREAVSARLFYAIVVLVHLVAITCPWRTLTVIVLVADAFIWTSTVYACHREVIALRWKDNAQGRSDGVDNTASAAD